MSDTQEKQHKSIFACINTALQKISRIYPVILAAFVMTAVTGIFLGYDIWFHIKNGEYILQTHAIPHKDVFLLSTPFLPYHYFTNYEWLFGVISFLVFKSSGLEGIHIFRTVIVCASLAVVYASSLKLMKNEYRDMGGRIALLCTFLAFLASFSRFEPRPQIISALCLALFVFILAGGVSRMAPLFIFLISLIWANCHIEIIAGIILICLIIAEKYAAGRLRLDEPEAGNTPYGKDSLKYTIVCLGAAIAGFLLSPTARGGIFQLKDYYSRSNVLMYSEELAPLTDYFTSPYGILFIIGIISFIAIACIDRKHLTKLIVFLPFGLLPFFNSRHVLAASMVITPIIAANLAGWISVFSEKSKPGFRQGLNMLLSVIFPVMLAFCWSIFIVPKPKPLIMAAHKQNPAEIETNPDSQYPDGAIRFLNRKGIAGNLFCPFHWGNFVIFYENPYIPQNNPNGSIVRKPFIDGMLQTYDNKLMNDYMSLLRGENRERIMAEYSLNLFVLPYPQSAGDSFLNLGQYLRNNPDWSLIYWDDTAIVYAKNSLIENLKDITAYPSIDPGLLHLMGGGRDPQESERFLTDINKSLETDFGKKVLKTYIWKGVMLYRAGDVDGAISALEQGKQINSNSLNLLFNLAIAHLKKGNITIGREYLKQCLKLNPSFRQAKDLLNQFR